MSEPALTPGPARCPFSLHTGGGQVEPCERPAGHTKAHFTHYWERIPITWLDDEQQRELDEARARRDAGRAEAAKRPFARWRKRRAALARGEPEEATAP